MIIAFLVDTSPYMDQCFSDGANLLTAVKKAAIDMVQQLETTSTSVRYLLVTYGKEATSVKCDLSTTSNQMLYALQQLSSNNNDSWNPGDALRTLFNTLSVDRTMRNVDTFGRGRIPGMNEPVKIIWCSYGGRVLQGDQTLEIPGSSYPGVELYREPFRWDERIHLMLMLPNGVTPAVEQLSMMANLTGGEVSWPTSSDSVNEFMKRVILPQNRSENEQMYRSDDGVMIHFEDVGQHPTHGTTHAVLSAFISLQPGSCTTPCLPIPENYWPTSDMTQLPVRMAHPMLRMIWQSGYWTSKVLPQECYNVYSKPLLVYMQNYPRDGHWKIYATDSASSSGLGDPFGVLQWSTVDDTATDIQLVILPYNYPQLSAILEDKSDTRIDAAINYIANIPCYYRKYAIQLFRQHDILINRVPVSIDELSPRVFQQISHIIDTTKTIVNAKKRVQINPFDVAINEMDTRLAELQVSLLKEVPGFSTVRIKWPEWGTNLSPCITYGDHLTPIASPVFPSVIMASTTTTDMDMDMEIDVQVALEDTAISDITSDKRDMTTTTSSVPLTKANNDTTTNESIIPSKRVNEHEVDSTESGVSASKMARLEMNTDKSSRTVANTAGTSTTTTMKATALPESTKKEITPSNNGASKVSTDVVASTATTSTVTKPVKPIKPAVATPPLEAYNDVKTRLVKHIKQGRKQYNENEIIDELGRLIKTKGYTRDQKRSILAGCLLAARTMKRKTLIETLDQLKAKLD